MQNFPFFYTYYPQKGVDKTLIMLHGWGCSGNVFKNYIDELNKNYNIFVIDFYGFGQSIDPKPFFDTYEYALQLFLFLQKKGIKELSIFAHSFGVRVAVILSSLFDMKIDKLLISGGAGIKPKYSLRYYVQVWLYKLKKKIWVLGTEYGSRDYVSCDGVLRKVFVRVVNQHLDYLLYNVCASKVLLVWGQKDRDTPMRFYQKFLKNIFNSRGFVIKNASHFCVFSHIYLCKNKVIEFFDGLD